MVGTRRAVAPSMMKKRFAALLGVMLDMGAVSAPALAAETASSSTTATSAGAPGAAANVPSGVSLGSSADEARYAAREAATPEAKKYKGGDVIVISVTAVVVVLLIVVIILLL